MKKVTLVIGAIVLGTLLKSCTSDNVDNAELVNQSKSEDTEEVDTDTNTITIVKEIEIEFETSEKKIKPTRATNTTRDYDEE